MGAVSIGEWRGFLLVIRVSPGHPTKFLGHFYLSTAKMGAEVTDRRDGHETTDHKNNELTHNPIF
jgi:hypothetical protein